MAIQGDNLADLVATTLRELGRGKFSEIATDLQKHIAMRRLIKKNRVTYDGGYGVQFDVMTDQNNSARFVGLYASDNVNVTDVMVQGNVPWRHVTWNWAIERREIAMNSGAARIVELVKTRRIASMISAAQKFEDRFWRCPASTDDVNPYGVPYWIVKSNTEGFSGGAATGYTAVGGLSPTTYPRWRNWTNQYTAVTKDDLIRKWRKAAHFTDWEPPVDGIPDFNTGDQYGFYTNYAVRGTLVEILEAQNDDLGSDVSPYEGSVTMMRTPVEWVPKLEEDSTNPVYGINWGEFKTIGLRGEWMRETQIPIQPGQHTVAATHTDCSFNWITRNRRRHFVLATDTTMPA